MKKIIYCLLAVCLAFSVLLIGCAKPAPAPAPAPAPSPAPETLKQLRFLSSSVGTQNFGIDSYLAGVVSKKLGIPCGAFPGGIVTLLPLLNDGEGEFGLTVPSSSGPAYKGDDPFDRALTNVRFMQSRGGYATPCVTRMDSDIKTLEDLKGKRIAWGGKGESAEVHARAMLQAAGITPEEIEAAGGVLSNMSYQAMGEALADGTVDAIWLNNQLTSPHTAVMLAEERFGLRLVPLPEGALEKGLKENIYSAKMCVKGGTFKGSPEDVCYLGFPAQTLCRADLPDNLVYDVMKVMYEPDVAKYIADTFPASALWGDIEDGLAAAHIVPMHPGAAKYWTEDRGVDLKARGITVK